MENRPEIKAGADLQEAEVVRLLGPEVIEAEAPREIEVAEVVAETD